jgi:Lrp/AsnC family transcriptional regulator, leucine-responsive regulatory protein
MKDKHGISSQNKKPQLDASDLRLLSLLQRDNTLTNLELAEAASLSPPTCLRRVRRLRDEGIIVADVSIVDPFKLGRKIIVFVEITLERQQEEMQSAFEQKMQAEAEIMQCYMISGDSDFLVVAQVADMNAFHALIRRVFTGDPNVRNFRSIFALSRPKFQTAISLD